MFYFKTCFLKSVGWGLAMAVLTGLFFFGVGCVMGLVFEDEGDVAQALTSGLGLSLFFFPPALHFGFNVSLWQQMKGKVRYAHLWFYSIASITGFFVHLYYYWVCNSIDKNGYFSYWTQALFSLIIGALSGIIYVEISAKETIFSDDSGKREDGEVTKTGTGED